MNLKFSKLSMLVIASSMLAMAGQAFAGTTVPAGEDLQVTTNATSICHGNRPVDNAQLNYRALQLDNVGTQAQYVTCAFATLRDQNAGSNRIVSYFGAFFANKNATDATITCTGVQGVANEPDNFYESQSTVVPANNAPATATSGYIFFGPASEGDPLYYQNVSMTCLVPAGVSIADTYVGFKLDDAVNAPAP